MYMWVQVPTKSTGSAGEESREGVSHLTWVGTELQGLGELYEHWRARPPLQAQSLKSSFSLHTVITLNLYWCVFLLIYSVLDNQTHGLICAREVLGPFSYLSIL